MRYDAPAIETRFEVRAELSAIISGINSQLQPVWRRAQGKRHDGVIERAAGGPMRYHPPAVVARFEVRAGLGNPISGVDRQPVWRETRSRRVKER